MIQIIPAIDIIDGMTVRLTRGEYASKRTYSYSPLDMAKRFRDNGIRRIHLVDLDGAKAGMPKNLKTLELIASSVAVETEWGGGITSDEALASVFGAGGNHAIIGSIAAREPERFGRWLQRFGGERIILGADVSNGKIAVKGWTETCDLGIGNLVEKFIGQGLEEVICTDISKDGMLQGPAYGLYAGLQESYPEITFTASGGISTMKDIERLNDLGIKRVIVGKAVYEGRITLNEIQEWSRKE